MRPERTIQVFCLVACSAPAWAQTTTRVSVDSGGVQSNGASQYSSISSDARWVAFSSLADNLVLGDTNAVTDVFVHDRLTGATTRASVDSAGAQGNAPSCGFQSGPALSADGRYIAFQSGANNLVTGDVNNVHDVFVHDCQSGLTDLVSIATGGTQGIFMSGYAGVAISDDGRFVAFDSLAYNLVQADTNGTDDIFVHDRLNVVTERVSVATGGAESNASSQGQLSISSDGRYIVFQSQGSNLVLGDTNGTRDIFVRDRLGGTTERVSVATGGAQGNADSRAPSISADGQVVAFESDSINLVSGDTNNQTDIFVRFLQGGQTIRVSVDSSGVQIGGRAPSMSPDGAHVAFASGSHVYVHDVVSGITSCVSVDSGGALGNGTSNNPSVSLDGVRVAFASLASNLVPGDTNLVQDIFLHDRGALPTFAIASFCSGDGSIIPCPCGNTGQPGHGCNNSISTGGGLLAGSGEALLTADTLVLTASQERPTAFSLFWQAGSEIAPRVFGDGIGCMGSPLKRMFFHNAVGGVVSVPQGADLSISARSSALGDPISPGTIRVYHVFYRDPDPNFCPTPFGSTFNTTNGLRVLWGG